MSICALWHFCFKPSELLFSVTLSLFNLFLSLLLKVVFYARLGIILVAREGGIVYVCDSQAEVLFRALWTLLLCAVASAITAQPLLSEL